MDALTASATPTATKTNIKPKATRWRGIQDARFAPALRGAAVVPPGLLGTAVQWGVIRGDENQRRRSLAPHLGSTTGASWNPAASTRVAVTMGFAVGVGAPVEVVSTRRGRTGLVKNDVGVLLSWVQFWA